MDKESIVEYPDSRVGTPFNKSQVVAHLKKLV